MPRSLSSLLVLCLVLVSCALPGGGGQGGSGLASGRGGAEASRPSVRVVPSANLDLLFQTARDYVKEAFDIEYEDSAQRVAETPLLEWEVDQVRHRSRITIEVTPDPRNPHHGRLGVLAQRIEALVDFDAVETGRPAKVQWASVGTINDLQKLFADQIVQRYQLARSGGDPQTIRPAANMPKLSRAP